jgi:hypothetical protein
VSYITKLHQSTMIASGLQPEIMWEICIEIIAHIIDEIVAARNCYSDSGEQNPAYFLWGMLKAWEIQKRYLDNNFLDDPALNGIFVRRAVLRSMDAKVTGQVRELMNRVSVLEKTPVKAATPRKKGKQKKGAAEQKEDDEESE